MLSIHRITLGISQAYLLEYARGLTLVDAGAPYQEARVLAVMRQIGRLDLRLIFITHAHLDHYGSAAALRRITGAKVAIHSADGGAMSRGETELGQARGFAKVLGVFLRLFESLIKPEPVLADLLVDDGDDLSIFGLDTQVLHVPGHTPGSSCLLVDGRYAFVGDLISTVGKPHVQRSYAKDWSQISSSLTRLGAKHPQKVFPGHGFRSLDGNSLASLISR